MLSTMTVNTTQLVASSYIVVLGLGMGLVMPTLTIALQNEFPPEQRGVVTSSSQFFRSIGGTLGVTILGVVMNHRSIDLLQKKYFPVIQGIPQLQAGPFGSLLEKAHSNPQALFNVLLSPDTMSKIPKELQQVLLIPLKTILADSLHVVFLVAMGVSILGIAVTRLMGDVKVVKSEVKKQVLAKGAIT